MRTCLGAWIFATVAWLCGCSDFYSAGASYGVPQAASGDTVRTDTVYTSEDTVSIPGAYAFTDTLWEGAFVVRPGRVLTILLETGGYSAADSVALLASFASSDSLIFSVLDSTGGAKKFSRTESRQGDNYRQDLKVPVQSSSLYALSWAWPAGSKKSQALVALAYSPKSLGNVLSRYEIYESQALPGRRPMRIDSSSWSWQVFPVMADDRVTVAVMADSTLEAYLLTSAAMESFFLKPSVPAQTLYNRTNDGDAWEFDATEADTLYWLLHNPTKSALEFQDSLLARQGLAP